MVFSSIDFLLYFFPLFFVIYWITPTRFRNIVLLLGSMIFYTLGDPAGIVLLGVSVPVNYLLGIRLYAKKRLKDRKKNDRNEKIEYKRRLLLILGIVSNVVVLMLFKTHIMGNQLPLGISFYTFQIVSFLIDMYRGTTRREKSLVNFAAYVVMFPKILQGPITRYEDLRYDLESPKISAESLQSGLGILTAGLACKVILADQIAILWNDAQNIGYESLSTPYAWLAAVAYSMKLYFDFYGYSLMAAGLGQMLGFSIPENFQEPYMARGVRDFYRRWHMTLGAWFRDYIYIPLGGSRKGELRTVVNLLIVWLVTALWHGETGNFLLWGGILFLCIVLERWLSRWKLVSRMKLLPHLYLWAVIPVTWMCFAIPDMQELHIYLGRMFGFVEGVNVRARDWLYALGDFKFFLLAGVMACTPVPKMLYRTVKDHFMVKLFMAVLFWVCIWRISVEGNNPFMYLRF